MIIILPARKKDKSQSKDRFRFPPSARRSGKAGARASIFHAFRLFAKKKCIETNAFLQKTQRETQPKKTAKKRLKPCGANFSQKKKGQNG